MKDSFCTGYTQKKDFYHFLTGELYGGKLNSRLVLKYFYLKLSIGMLFVIACISLSGTS